MIITGGGVGTDTVDVVVQILVDLAVVDLGLGPNHFFRLLVVADLKVRVLQKFHRVQLILGPHMDAGRVLSRQQ